VVPGGGQGAERGRGVRAVQGSHGGGMTSKQRVRGQGGAQRLGQVCVRPEVLQQLLTRGEPLATVVVPGDPVADVGEVRCEG